MSSYYKLSITKTSAPLFSSDWSRYDHEEKKFSTEEEARDYLKEKYAKASRQRMFRDNMGEAGWIYKFRSSYGNETWNENHWTEISKIEETIIP